MLPETILLTIRAGFECVTELVKYLQTPEGQKFATKLLEDREAWDGFWLNIKSGLKTLFSGELFTK